MLKKNDKILVVGSGLSGAITALRLIENGFKVTMFDIGNPESREWLKIKNDYIKRKNYSYFVKKFLSKNFKFFKKMNKGYFSNNFSIAELLKLGPVKTDALGGFSNIWGANMLPYHYNDIKNWPIASKDLEYNYEYLADKLNLSSDKNNSLNKFFRLKTKITNDSKNLEDAQTKEILSILNKNKNILTKKKIYFGKTNLALSKKNNNKNISCQKCGLCFYQCPYDVIFNSKYLIEYLRNNKNFFYKSNSKLLKIKEIDNKVAVYVEHTKKNIVKYKFDKVFLSCGTYPILDILFDSNIINKKITLQDAQQFIFFGKIKNYKKNIDLEKNTMSKINIEINNKDISKKFIHLQIYPLSDVIFSRSFPKLFSIFSPLFNYIVSFFKKYFIIIGYLPGIDSSKINYFADRSISVVNKKNSKKKIIKIIDYLNNSFNNNSLRFIKLIKIMQSGQSFHIGSAFPISKKPKKNQSDSYGRINRLKNTFILDSLILPNIYANTTTFTSLANIVRIVDTLSKKSIKKK